MKQGVPGERYGRLVFVEEVPKSKASCRRWLVRCDCGVQKEIGRSDVVSGHTRSCGCLRRENATKYGHRAVANGQLSQYRHGLTDTPIYRAWASMKTRCRPSWWVRFPTYTGTQHCPEWATIEGFLANQPPGRSYEPGLQLSRIWDAGNYEPSNCQWLTKAENIKEKWDRMAMRTSDGRPARDVALEHGVRVKTLYSRVASGWDITRAATTPSQRALSGEVSLG